ncbi:MAG: response regulator transcription factor [Cyanobacteria bacterium P01_F01_bin.86]
MTTSQSDKQQFFVVDDHASVLDGTVLALRQTYTDIEVDTAQTAQEARVKLSNLQPDVVIVDLSIPESAEDAAQTETGINLLREFLENYPDYNFVVQSAYVKALVRIKPSIDAHQGGLTIVDKSEPIKDMLAKVDWALKGVVCTPREMRIGLEIKSEWLRVLELAFREGMKDRAIAQEMNIAERTVRHYWTKVQDVLGVYPEDDKSMRIQTELRAREEGLID